MRTLVRALIVTLSAVAMLPSGRTLAAETGPGDALAAGFRSPPDSAKPRVWWHWMDGNITPQGISRDLEWMHRIGIGGVNAVEASMRLPQIVDDRLVYLSPRWKESFRHATEQADQLNLEMSIFTSPGWSETGGPWVKPAQAMKKLVWTRTVIRGGHRFKGVLTAPPDITGPFQNVAYVPREAGTAEGKSPPRFHADAGVIAYRLPEERAATARVTIISSAGPIDAALLSDGDLQKALLLPVEKGMAWVQFNYERPQTIRSAVLGSPSPVSGTFGNLVPPVLTGKVEAQSEDGRFRSIATLGITGSPQVTASFAPVTARVFRVTLSLPGPPPPDPSLAPAPGADTSFFDQQRAPEQTSLRVSELSLHSVGRVNEFERKASFELSNDYYALDTPQDAADAPVSVADVLDLSKKMRPDGTLDWSAPPGQWVVLRLGYSLTGMVNSPAPAEATGLEVDKLSSRYTREYMDEYLSLHERFVPSALIGARGLRAIMVDSTEVGPQNWTDDMLAQFKRLRGYDPQPWLPALTGVIVDSAAATDKFLWDFRRTIAQLRAESHYAGIAAAAHARGLTLYGEAIENQRQALGDDMEMRRYADVPSGAMWAYPPGMSAQPTFMADTRGAASVAHLYGQNLAAAESFTSALKPWAHAPRDLKPIADLEFALGINRIIVHSSVHQPDEKAPGITLGPVGQYFNRHETWAEQAGAWVSYLARSSYLLQQGRFAADVAYFYGEEAPLTLLNEQGRLNDVPKSYAFDFVNADALLNLLEARDGYLIAPSGARYRALQLGGTSRRMTLSVLRKIRDFVQQGVIVVGAAPVDSPSLADDDVEFQQLRMRVWGSEGEGARRGSGRVYGKVSVETALAAEHLLPDLIYSRPHADTELLFVHRRLPDGEIYFLTNRKDRSETLDVSLRVTGKTPELWRAETGESEPVSFRIDQGRTLVPLKLKPHEAVFVVLRKPATAQSFVLPEPMSPVQQAIKGSWKLSFQPGRGAPASITVDELRSWSESADPGVRYFSGTASYEKALDVPVAALESGTRLLLNLGDVRELAEIAVNGKSLGVLWHPPYTVDVTNALHPGANALELKVTNLWVNRLIGDKQPGATQYTFTTSPTYIPAAPLRASGLLGPVTLEQYGRRHGIAR